MIRFAFLCLTLLLPSLVRAELCQGNDLLAAMPEAERAALEARADASAFGRGLFFKATRDDKQITVFGSYHLPHLFTEDHLALLLPLARHSDITYFEMNGADTERFELETQSNPELMFVPADRPTLPGLLSETEWADLSVKMSARGFPPFLAAKMKPIFVSMMLGMSPCNMRQMQSGARGIDRALAEVLDAEGLPSRSIEDYRTAAKLLDAFTPEKQIELLRLSLVQDVNADDMVETLYQAYIREEIALIWEFTRDLSLEMGGATAEEDFALFEKLLLTDRNLAWHKELMAAQEKRILVVVGAAHLAGENGVLALLQADGFTVERLPLMTGK